MNAPLTRREIRKPSTPEGAAPATTRLGVLRRKAVNGGKRIAKVRLLPLSLPLFAVMRLIRPLLLIRLNPLRSELGHFAANTELYLCERDAGINCPKRPHVDLCYLSTGKAPNAQLDAMWRRVIRIWPTWLLAPVYELNEIFPGGSIHQVGPNTQHDRDVNDLITSTKCHIGFTAAERARGEAGLRELGIPEGAPFVCVIVRDEAYHKTHFPDADYDYHSYRNADIRDYVAASDALVARGYRVVRMGSIVKEPLPSTKAEIIDYATSGLRSDFMDIYLGAHCAFCLSSGTGYDAVPFIFRRPIAYANMAPIGYLYTFLANAVAVCKKHWLVAESRWLTLSEIVDRGLAACLDTKCFEQKGVDLVQNSPEEIRDVVVEMIDRLEGVWVSDPRDEALQEKFWKLYPLGMRDFMRQMPVHGRVRAKYSAFFLRNNPEWVQ